MNLDINASKLRDIISPETDRKPRNQKSRKKILRRSVKNIWRYIKCLTRSVRIFLFDMVLVEGTEKHSGLSVKTLYVGEIKVPVVKFGKFYLKSETDEKYENFKFVMDSIYSDYTIIWQKENINGLSISHELKKCEAQADMVFIDAELLFVRMLERERYLAVPLWVPLKLNIPDRWEDVVESFPKRLRKELKRILKHDYQFSVATTDNHFQIFTTQCISPIRKHALVKQRVFIHQMI